MNDKPIIMLDETGMKWHSWQKNINDDLVEMAKKNRKFMLSPIFIMPKKPSILRRIHNFFIRLRMKLKRWWRGWLRR
jgi:hypothetical protein